MLAASTFEWVKALVAPVFGFLAIVIAAGVTARTANSRQRQQLDHDLLRHREQLAHDRDLRELEHLRDFFDEVAGRFEGYADAIHQLDVAVQSPVCSAEDKVHAFMAVNEAYGELGIAIRRFGFRMSVDTPVFEALWSAVLLLEQWANTLQVVLDGEILPTARQSAIDFNDEPQALSKDPMAAWRAFVDLARNELEHRAAVAGPPAE